MLCQKPCRNADIAGPLSWILSPPLHHVHIHCPSMVSEGEFLLLFSLSSLSPSPSLSHIHTLSPIFKHATLGYDCWIVHSVRSPSLFLSASLMQGCGEKKKDGPRQWPASWGSQCPPIMWERTPTRSAKCSEWHLEPWYYYVPEGSWWAWHYIADRLWVLNKVFLAKWTNISRNRWK